MGDFDEIDQNQLRQTGAWEANDTVGSHFSLIFEDTHAATQVMSYDERP